MATNDELLRALMKRQAASKAKMASAAQRQRGLSQRANAQVNPTVGGGALSTSVGGRAMQIPQEERINWGGIIDKGIGRFQEARADVEMEKLQEESANTEIDIANEIYQSTMKDDPEGAKLIKMAQLGIPGAEQALAKHLTPKTQSLAVLVQAITTGKLSPEMAAELAPQFGLSPEMVSKGAAYATEQIDKAQNTRFQQQAALRQMSGGGGGGGSSSGKLSFEEYRALSPEDKAAYDDYTGKGGRNAKLDGMTPGERNTAAKEIVKSEEKIREGQITIAKGEGLKSVIYDPETFGATQKVSQAMSEFNNPIISGIGVAMRSKGVAALEDYMNDEVLDRMSQLGGSDSNEELKKMRASLPSAMNNHEAAKDLYERVLKFQKRKLQEEKVYQEKLRSGKFFQPQGEEKPTGQIEILEILP